MTVQSVPTDTPGDVPDPEALAEAFHVYEVEVTDDGVRYYGEPLTMRDDVVQRLAPTFREAGYRVRMTYETGEFVLVATERSLSVDGVPWTNLVLFLTTVATTLFAGSQWYGLPVSEDPLSLVHAWPFAVSVLGVLAVHELGHYVLSRYHEVQATLPYFIPIPNVLGTLGAVIRMQDNIPSRDALFDIGVAGPLAGIVATVVVTTIGLSLDPIRVSHTVLVSEIELGYPLLIQGLATLLGEQLHYSDPGLMVNPVVVGGWVGAFVTFLNLLPVGQLDGAHVTRAVVGDAVDTIGLAVPGLLFALAGYLYLFADGRGAFLWAVWGVLTLLVGRMGNATPIDETPVGRRRQAVAVVTLVVGALCFAPVPIAFA